MLPWRLGGLVLFAVALAPPAPAQERTPATKHLTFAQAIDLARRQAPALLAIHARIGEARAEAERARLWPFNPELDASVGPRSGSGETSTEWSVGLRQWLETGGQRSHRTAMAHAEIDTADAQWEDALRRTVQRAGLAFVEALYWQRRLALAEESVAITAGIERVARRRRELGDATGLDASVAALALARARLAQARAGGEVERALGTLRLTLGIESHIDLRIRGDITTFAVPQGASGEPLPRADVRVLQAELRRARAAIDLARSQRAPNVGVGATYAREEGDEIVQGTLAISLPLFDHGQGDSAVALAQLARVQVELAAAQQRASVEIATARAVADRFGAAARRFESEGVVLLAASEAQARKGYDAGALPLAELLAVRSELVQAKVDYTDLLFEAAVAEIEFAAASGAWIDEPALNPSVGGASGLPADASATENP